MILYPTKQTWERYKLKTPEQMDDPITAELSRRVIDQEQGDRLLEWGAKLFYLNGRKCLLCMNFASKLTALYPNLKIDELPYVGETVAQQMLDTYRKDADMTRLLERLFEEHPIAAFAPLKDKSAIAALNHRLAFDMFDGERLYDYMWEEPGRNALVLHSRKFCYDMNWDSLVSAKIDGKTKYFLPAERFEVLLRTRYGVPLRKEMKADSDGTFAEK